MFPPTRALKYGTEELPVYIHSCLEIVTWGPDDVIMYGPIQAQGCDRCECAPDGEWREVRVPL